MVGKVYLTAFKLLLAFSLKGFFLCFFFFCVFSDKPFVFIASERNISLGNKCIMKIRFYDFNNTKYMQIVDNNCNAVLYKNRM